jgi:hypothetical protein
VSRLAGVAISQKRAELTQQAINDDTAIYKEIRHSSGMSVAQGREAGRFLTRSFP